MSPARIGVAREYRGGNLLGGTTRKVSLFVLQTVKLYSEPKQEGLLGTPLIFIRPRAAFFGFDR